MVAALSADAWLQGAIIGSALGVAAIVLNAFGPAWAATLLRPCRMATHNGVRLCASVGVGLWRAHAEQAEPSTTRFIAALMVVWVIVTLWAPLFAGGFVSSGYGSLKATTVRDVPIAGQYVNDDALYRRVFYLMHDGVPYYQAYKQAWLGLKPKPALPTAVTAYRLPTMYWLWSLLPPDAFLIEIVFLALVSGGCVGAALIAGQLAGARFAPLAAVALAVFAMGSASTVYVTYVDLPSASVALLGVALFVRASVSRDRRFLWAAAGVLTLAALTREILAYLIVLGAASALFAPRGERVRGAGPWLTALGVFAIGYAAHAVTVLNVMHATSSTLSYFGGSPAFSLDALRRFATVMQGGGLLLPILFALGVFGAAASAKRAGVQFAVFAVAALVVPILAMMKLGNPAIDAAGHQVNYWGNLFVPLALALWPVSAMLLPRLPGVEAPGNVDLASD